MGIYYSYTFIEVFMMFPNNDYVRRSLELNLFFSRIMKEHALFIAAGFLPKNQEYINEALRLNEEFNRHLAKAVDLSRGVVPINNDAVTDYTLDAERDVSELTGVPIDTNLTRTEMNLRNQNLNIVNDPSIDKEVRELNDRIIRSARNLIRFKTKLINDFLECHILFNSYPALLEHIRREAILYVEMLTNLQNNAPTNKLIEDELFWNEIMGEHAEFIRGFLDPSEIDLMVKANNFAIKFEELNTKIYESSSNASMQPSFIKNSLNLTKQIKGFKTAATEGMLKCGIKSITNSLLADHTLREANHYIRILERKH